MNIATVTRLNAANLAFYHQVAESFSSTRQYPWQSWERFLSLSRFWKDEKSDVSVADVGCGNGRFATWLNEGGLDCAYLGVDSDPTLLLHAKTQHPDHHFLQKDVVASLVSETSFLSSRHDLIVVFGVLHHVPSHDIRTRLFERLASSLLPGGELWLTAWVPEGPFFDNEDVCDLLGVSESELEAGDHFLGWKNTSAIRYVHCIQPQESESWSAETDLELCSSWTESEKGERGNTCLLFRKKS